MGLALPDWDASVSQRTGALELNAKDTEVSKTI